MQAGELSGHVALKQGWTTFLTEKAIRVGIDQRIQELGIQFPLSDGADITMPKDSSHTYVSWDCGCVASSEMKPLYSKEFGICLAVLGRGFKKDEESVSYTCLHHVWQKPENFINTLQKLVDKVEAGGRIEICISGGQENSKRRLENVKAIIEKFATEHQGFIQLSAEEKNTTFGIANLGKGYLQDDTCIHQGSANLTAWFDKDGNPFQSIDASFSSYKGDGRDIIQTKWERDIYGF